MNGTFAPATASAAEVDFLDLLEKEEADFADQGWIFSLVVSLHGCVVSLHGCDVSFPGLDVKFSK